MQVEAQLSKLSRDRGFSLVVFGSSETLGLCTSCRASAARDVVPTLRVSGGRVYLFLEDGRMGALLVTDAERLQVHPTSCASRLTCQSGRLLKFSAVECVLLV